MRSFYAKAFLAALLYLVVFIGVFTLMQNQTVYDNSLGRISKNYVRTGDWDKAIITQVNIPYTKITEQNFQHWDADIYRCISQQMYVQKLECFGFVSGAFFPLFPILWKTLHVNSIGISLVNYFLFIISLMLLINAFLKTTENNKLIIYLLCITLPSTVVFMIPYTEALFMFTSTMAFLGIKNKNYKLYFISSIALAMVRPATMFVFLSLFCIELLVLFKNRNFKNFFKESILKLSPFLLGYILSLSIQFVYSHSWTTYLDAQKHWTADIGLIKTFSDWSVEGFGLSVFAIFFICIPALAYLCYSIFKNKWDLKTTLNIFKEGKDDSAFNYISMSSFFYVSGLLIFAAAVSGGNLHSFSRFILCSPAFYCLLIFVFNKLHEKRNFLQNLIVFDICLAMYFLFLSGVDFGGDRTDFQHWGSYLMVLNLSFFLFYSHLNTKFRMGITVGLVLVNVIWNTYLFNCFLSDSWIFT